MTATVRQWVRLFNEGTADQRDLLGGKGANLAEMTRIGLPVPPGFTVTTKACNAYMAANGTPPPDLWADVDAGMADLQQRMGRTFADAAKPLLVSVRSGAKFSMPGMMETVLNLGLNDEAVSGLAALTNDRFAYDAYRRLIQMFGKVVLGLDADLFEAALTEAKRVAGTANDHELTAVQLADVVVRFKAIITAHGAVFPQDPREQLREAILGVFRSWNTPRAIAYRRSNRISESLGTAVNVQAMVFGNIGPDCASGVAFTRDPNTGERGLFGEFLANAQGEDVVSGIRTPRHVDEMAEDAAFAGPYRELLAISETLEQHYTDMQDVEFTVENGKLWMLQTRNGKRTAPAAVRIAVDMAEEGLIDQPTAVRRVEPTQLEQLLHPRIDTAHPVRVLATGLPASPGAAYGRAVFDPMEAKRRGEAGEEIILVRLETSADDFPGMERSRGILTARGGMTSHAAVVARGMGKPAIVGCGALEWDPDAKAFRVGNQWLRENDRITLDGATGRVILGRAHTIEPSLSGGAEQLLRWADALRTMGIRANADTPADAARARSFGAEGIGLCRTEHMFFGEQRIDAVRELILAHDDAQREHAISVVEPLQAGDFEGIFRAMDGLPVKIRLIDPPLHEFLPHTREEMKRLSTALGMSVAQIEEAVESHREANPMLGLRGVRLGITRPEITRMQARAIFTAAIVCAKDGVTVHPEIMVPLVGDAEELRRQRDLVDEVAHEVFARLEMTVPYHVGTMIELPRAALLADRIAAHADFFSFGTNDLTQMTYGLSRDDANRFLPTYIEQGIYPDDPFQTLDRDGVGQLVKLGTERGRSTNPELTVAICGEHGGDPASIAFCQEAGLNYVSCSPFRIPIARLAAAHAALGAERHDI